jgi:hypothetical protein
MGTFESEGGVGQVDLEIWVSDSGIRLRRNGVPSCSILPAQYSLPVRVVMPAQDGQMGMFIATTHALDRRSSPVVQNKR